MKYWKVPHDKYISILNLLATLPIANIFNICNVVNGKISIPGAEEIKDDCTAENIKKLTGEKNAKTETK